MEQAPPPSADTDNAHRLKWDGNSPLSSQFDDIYFNPEFGIEETQYVFLNGNRFDQLLSSNQNQITIAETGFGTGLNFLCTAMKWSEYSNEIQDLHYISVEKYPLAKKDLKKALESFLFDTPLLKELTDKYSPQTTGSLDILFSCQRIRLTIMFGDAAECYNELNAKIDAWYLDGFAPSKNPDMWSPELFQQIARLSHPGTTFSTFTAAGIVRRGLQEVGFEVRKQKGFGRKREMLVGTFIEHKKPLAVAKPWFELPKGEKPESVTIIGGGLSGCTTARALAERGVKVTLIEKEDELATAGSGNRQGALYAKLPVKPTKQGELHLSGFLHTLNELKQLDPQQTLWSQCGVAQLAINDKELKRQQELIERGTYPAELVCEKTAEELTSIAGSTIVHGGLFFPDAGWVAPKALSKTLVKHENIDVIKAQITSIERFRDKWVLTDTLNNCLDASHLVICNAELANQFKQTSHIPLKAIRGQVSISAAPEAHQLNTVVCGEGYISPAQDNLLCFGATFDLKGTERNVTDTDHAKNLLNLQHALPELHREITESSNKLQGRTAFRCSTPDYMPVVGPAPVYETFVETFARLRKDKNWQFENCQASHHPNLFINTGHGSKGLITCPISAQLVAAMICDEPLPLPRDLIDTINPARFIIKNLIKQAI